MATMYVRGAGTAAINGDYTETGTQNGKPYYNKSGTAWQTSSIYWNTGGTLGYPAWIITASSGGEFYDCGEDTATPNDEVTTWGFSRISFGGGSNPPPTVSNVAPATSPKLLSLLGVGT